MLRTLTFSFLAVSATLAAALLASGLLTAIILLTDTLIRGYTPAAVAHGGALAIYLLCFVLCFPAVGIIAARKWLKRRR